MNKSWSFVSRYYKHLTDKGEIHSSDCYFVSDLASLLSPFSISMLLLGDLKYRTHTVVLYSGDILARTFPNWNP